MTDKTTGIKFWVEAWEPFPLVCNTEQEALEDGERSRQREIARLQARIERVRSATLQITRYNPDEGLRDVDMLPSRNYDYIKIMRSAGSETNAR